MVISKYIIIEVELYYLSVIMDQFTLVFPPTDPPTSHVFCFCFHPIYSPPPIPYLLDLSFFFFFFYLYHIYIINHFYFSPPLSFFNLFLYLRFIFFIFFFVHCKPSLSLSLSQVSFKTSIMHVFVCSICYFVVL